MLIRVIPFIVLLSLIGAGPVVADALDQSRQIISQTNQQLKASQRAIDRADEATLAMLAEYKAVQRELDNYRVYNAQLEEIVVSQEKERQRLNGDIAKIESTGLEIMPFMQAMVDGLAQFIASDYPFLPQERQMRIERLRQNMKRADLSIAAKFRQILEAYQIEIDYGNTLEPYEGNLAGRKVDFLKVGRIGLYYLSLDRQQCGAWDLARQEWRLLEDVDYRLSIAKAIKIAKKHRAPDLFFAAVAQARGRE